jgi:hypothetical protein
MKNNLKKISVLGFIALFILSGIVCCCLSTAVQAQEPVSTCHQTSPDTDSSHAPKECGCMQNVGVLAHNEVFSIEFNSSPVFELKNITLFNGIISQTLHNPLLALNDRGSPKTAMNSTPIYIQNSVFRL